MTLLLRTWRGLCAIDGEVVDRGDCTIVRTPDNPGFYWANLLVLGEAPRPGTVAAWCARFAAEIGAPPAIEHVALAWGGAPATPAVAAELGAAGFTRDDGLALACDGPLAAPTPTGAVVRPLGGADDRARVEALTAAVYPGSGAFAVRHRAALWRAVDRGDGAWHGAFVDGALVASAAIVPVDELARYQEVQTHPAYRRRGLAGAVLASLADWALARPGVARLVIVVDPDDPGPQRLYRSLGFVDADVTHAWIRRPGSILSGSPPVSPA